MIRIANLLVTLPELALKIELQWESLGTPKGIRYFRRSSEINTRVMFWTESWHEASPSVKVSLVSGLSIFLLGRCVIRFSLKSNNVSSDDNSYLSGNLTVSTLTSELGQASDCLFFGAGRTGPQRCWYVVSR